MKLNDVSSNVSLSVGNASMSVSTTAPTVNRQRIMKARYDASLTTPDNYKHWSMADALSADAAASPDVRKRLRERARYEIANNTYAKGILLTLASDIVGTGPRLQLINPQSSKRGRRIERDFSAWMESTGLAEKLMTAAMAKIGDGEAFAVLVNRNSSPNPVKLDVKLLEADRICSSHDLLSRPDVVDGILCDSLGNPVAYEYLTEHPGGLNQAMSMTEWKRIPARWMCHWFRHDRPEQHRGVSEIASALPLFAQLRRYTLSTIAAAETASDFAAVLYTDQTDPYENQNANGVRAVPFDEVEITKRMMMTLPDNYKMAQFKPEQPVTTYAEFKREILGEIARCLQVPVNVANGDSSKHNYASGRLDHQVYHRAVYLTQQSCVWNMMEPIFREWMTEYCLVHDRKIVNVHDIPHTWFWDGFEHVDPEKEANAQLIRLESKTTSLATEYAKVGKDWEDELEQIAREQAKMKELGLTVESSSVNKNSNKEKNDSQE